ncbi:IS110 family transposase [Catellatospora bangladeshensis]|uniref:IS110 family transposase n=2 Tax=Catellatospora bangladeshensis TaxID=310355 RepID=A0A8J3JQ70_9ACTN|nr:IS110 family transposase [Catellatospora bangladeshensis]GIF86549.1 IS110 family transposase [Catellatospora bangladeshensis]
MPTMTHPGPQIIAGVDTHKDTHTAAVLDEHGRLLATAGFPATGDGYRQLLDWLATFGTPTVAGVEGTGSYGAGLTGYLTRAGVQVVEVARPDRATRRRKGKDDPADAEAAARAVLATRATVIPKQRHGQVEALRQLRVARRSAVTQRATVQRQIQDLVVTAAEEVRAPLRGLRAAALVRRCAADTCDPAGYADPTTAARIALRSLARRHQQLTTEIKTLDKMIEPLVRAINPTLLAQPGIGPDTAGQLLVTAGANPQRLHSQAAFAMLCGAAPLPASSGRTQRHRLNRGGDRQANCALYLIVLSRLRWNPQTQAYAQRRTTEGLSKKEIIRCLKRYLAREIYQIITAEHTHGCQPTPA